MYTMWKITIIENKRNGYQDADGIERVRNVHLGYQVVASTAIGQTLLTLISEHLGPKGNHLLRI